MTRQPEQPGEPGISDDARGALRALCARLHERFDGGPEAVGGGADAISGAFLDGREVEAAALGAALGEAVLSQVVMLGLVELSAARARGLVRFERWEGLVLGRDVEDAGTASREPVAGLGPNAKVLSRMTPRARVGRVLDLGCGQGFHALFAARHAREVVATDVSRHALRLAAINAAMNEVTGVEFRRGHLYEAVRGEAFDLIVSNTPFVFSPVHQVRAGEAPAAGDALVEAIVREAPGYLREGGLAAFICNWEHPDAWAWEEVPREWVRGMGVDAWIVRLRTAEVGQVMEAWFTNRECDGESRELGSAETLRRWKEHVERKGVGAVSLGLVFLSRRAGRNWVRCDSERLTAGEEPAGDQVRRVFENQTLLARGEEGLMERKFRAVGPVSYATSETSHFVLEHARGLRFTVGVEPVVRRLLEACDGVKTAREVVQEAAAAEGIPVGYADRVVRELLRRAYLEAC